MIAGLARAVMGCNSMARPPERPSPSNFFRSSLLAVAGKVVMLTLLLFCLATGGWAAILTPPLALAVTPTVPSSAAAELTIINADKPTASYDPRIAPLIEKLTLNDARIRRDASEALIDIGAPALPALITALQDPDPNLRWCAASVLGDMGEEAVVAIPALTQALQDSASQVRLYATLALGNLGSPAKAAIPALVERLKDPDPYIRTYASFALRKMGVEAKVAVPALVQALQDPNGRVRLNAAYALGAIGTEAAPAIPDLVHALSDPKLYVQYAAAKGLGAIADSFQDQASHLSTAHLREVIQQFEAVLELLSSQPDVFSSTEQSWIRRPLNALKAEKETRLLDKVWDWSLQHRWVLAIAAYLALLPTLWFLLLRFAPLWLLRLNDALKPYTDFALPVLGINVPLRYVLFVGWLHYHPRVLDAWVTRHAAVVREQFARKDTVQARSCYIPLPVVLEGRTIAELSVNDLRPTFTKQRTCVVIWGEGGVGKTSLACQIARWALAETESDRLYKHLSLPVLLEEEFRPVEGKSALLEAIRGQLQVLIDSPEPICAELLLRLLRKRRLLVIVDHLSEMPTPTRETIQPESPDFPINALVITSRLEESLGRVTKTVLKPLRLEANKLSSFMEAYLMQRGQRQSFTDPEFFEACQRLSLMVGERQITVLLAKLYAEQLIARRLQSRIEEQLPDSLPSLMLGYLNELNRDVTVEKREDRLVHRDAKAIAWACLQTSYQPIPTKRSDALAVLTTIAAEDTEARLDYLEHRLHLIQTVGAAQDQLRFSLDPLAEYLASLYLVDLYGTNEGKWRSTVLKKAEEAVKAGQQEAIKGFLLALGDCYLWQNRSAKATDFVPQRLSKLAGYPDTDPAPFSVAPLL